MLGCLSIEPVQGNSLNCSARHERLRLNAIATKVEVPSRRKHEVRRLTANRTNLACAIHLGYSAVKAACPRAVRSLSMNTGKTRGYVLTSDERLGAHTGEFRGAGNALPLFSEVGRDMSKWRTSAHFDFLGSTLSGQRHQRWKTAVAGSTNGQKSRWPCLSPGSLFPPS